MFQLSASASVVNHLYRAEVPVESRLADARQHALPSALQQVLAKVSGNHSITTLPAVNQQLFRANDWVQQFTYIQRDNQLLLQVSFDKISINQFLRDVGQAVWGENRPDLLVWLMVGENDSVEFVSNDLNTELSHQLHQITEAYGLPLVLPLYDLVDRQQVTSTDLTDLSSLAIQAASTRYPNQVILMGHIKELAPQEWQGSWKLLIQGEQMDWQGIYVDSKSTIEAAMRDVVDALASRFAILSEGSKAERLLLTVTNIQNAESYAWVFSYLQKLAAVKHVEVNQIDGDHIQFDVQLIGTQLSLEQAISLDARLKPIRGDSNILTSSHLSYRYL